MRWSWCRCKRWRNLLARKARLSAALLVAGLFSLRHPRDSWPRVSAALTTWLRWTREPRRTPRWIYYGRMRTCFSCPFFYAPLRTCGSPLRKELHECGCWCSMEHAAAVLEKECWYRTESYGDTEWGWDASLTRLSNEP